MERIFRRNDGREYKAARCPLLFTVSRHAFEESRRTHFPICIALLFHGDGSPRCHSNRTRFVDGESTLLTACRVATTDTETGGIVKASTTCALNLEANADRNIWLPRGVSWKLPGRNPAGSARYCNRRLTQINVTRAQVRRNLNFADNLLLR